uniref:Uncharacterized protein n=1 Tax=Magallana gigas TaxID=29159 RepID=K1QW19_MAGGI
MKSAKGLWGAKRTENPWLAKMTRVNNPRFTDDGTTYLFSCFINNRHRSVADDPYDQNFRPEGYELTNHISISEEAP